MTNEEIDKLSQIKDDIKDLQKAFNIINGVEEGMNKVSIKVTGYEVPIHFNKVPGLSDQLQYMAVEVIGERLDELESQLLSLVLCTVEQGSPVYSPAKITDETK
jgi:hypothetical protein